MEFGKEIFNLFSVFIHNQKFIEIKSFVKKVMNSNENLALLKIYHILAILKNTLKFRL